MKRLGKNRVRPAEGSRDLAALPAGPWNERIATVEDRVAWGMDPSLARIYREVCFVNNHTSVQISDEPSAWGSIVHLWIRRHDGAPIRSWPVLQRIKNELVGEDRIAVEVFPVQSDVVDRAPMSHLWVLPAGFVLPFGLRGPT